MHSDQLNVAANESDERWIVPQLRTFEALPQPSSPLAPRSSLPAPRSQAVPSRYSNPFATCWTRPGALLFQWPTRQSAARLIGELKQQQWQGAIIGPHGSGKSTLLATLIPHIQSAGVTVYDITLQDAQRRLPAGFLSTVPREHSLLIIDGYEQLNLFERYRLNRFCRQTGCGLLVTSHAPLSIPTLIELRPDAQLIRQLVEELTASVPTPVIPADVQASQERHGANVREIFFDLYDRHEKLQRGANDRAAGCVSNDCR